MVDGYAKIERPSKDAESTKQVTLYMHGKNN